MTLETQDEDTPLLETPLATPAITANGHELHKHVPPENWCVNILDLDDFAEKVREWNHSQHAPGEDGGPDGPTMGMVCERFMIPRTSEAGGMSWALMIRPGGLPTGLFVSHSFDEGVFEFHRKLRGSMPSGHPNFWSRFFSMPQCWSSTEQAALLGTDPLTDSPLAKAISQSSILIAVPNQSESLFHRSWCVLEACIAFQNEVTLMPATDVFACSRRTSIGSASHAAAKVDNSLPQAISMLFKDFESVRNMRIVEDSICTRVKTAIEGREDWLDNELKTALMELL